MPVHRLAANSLPADFKKALPVRSPSSRLLDPAARTDLCLLSPHRCLSLGEGTFLIGLCTPHMHGLPRARPRARQAQPKPPSLTTMSPKWPKCL